MKICLPVSQLKGLESKITPSFRATPALLVVDSNSQQFQEIDVSSSACRATPNQIDAIICAGGIGRGQFNGLRRRGVKVFLTDPTTVAEALRAFHAQSLVELHDVECCGGHEHTHPEKNHTGCGCNGHQNEDGTAKSCGCSHQ